MSDSKKQSITAIGKDISIDARTMHVHNDNPLTPERLEKIIQLERKEAVEEYIKANNHNEKVEPLRKINEFDRRLADLPQAFKETQDIITLAITLVKDILNREGKKIGTDKLIETRIALERGDFLKADNLFAEIEGCKELDTLDLAQLAYARGEIARHKIHWHDAAKHYARAAQLAPRFETLILAQKFAHETGDYLSALNLVLDAQKIAIKKYGNNTEEYALCINNLAGLYLANGEYKKAEYFLEETLKIYKNIFGENHYEIADTLNNIGGIYKEQEYYKKAEEFFNQALKIYEDTFGENHPDTANCFNNLGSVYQKQARYEEAGLFLNKSLKINKNIFGKDHPITAKSLNNLATFYHEQGQYKEAVPLYQQAIEISENILGPDHPQTKLFKENYEDLQKAIANAENDEPQ